MITVLYGYIYTQRYPKIIKAGCSGYMAPEYAFEGKFSVKSDIFSMGVVILEIVSGKRNRGCNDPSLLEQVKCNLLQHDPLCVRNK